MNKSAPESRSRSWLTVGAAALVTFGAFALLAQVTPTTPTTDDAVRDLLLAQDCSSLAECHTVGAPTSVPGISQGADWVDLLALVQRLRGGPDQIRIMVLILDALGVAAVFLLTARWITVLWAFPASVAALTVLLCDSVVGQMVNPSAVFLPDALCFALLVVFVSTRRIAPLLGAAFAAGVAMNFHVAAATLGPTVVLLAILASRRPVPATLLATALLFATALSTSASAWTENALTLWRSGVAIPGALVLGLATAACARARSSFEALSNERRIMVACGAALLPYLLGVTWLLGSGHWLALTYGYPIVVPASIVLVALVDRLLGARPFISAATSVVLALGVLHLEHVNDRWGRGASPGWTLADGSAIGAWARQHGWRYEQLLYHLQSSRCRELVAALGTELAPPDGERLDPTRTLRVLIKERGQGPDDVRLSSGSVAHMESLTSWLRPDRLAVCRVPPGGSPSCTQNAASIPPEIGQPRLFAFSARSFPGFATPDAPRAYVARYELPVDPPPTGSRDLAILDETGSCGWSITAVTGVVTDTSLPAQRIRMRASGQPGKIVLDRAVGMSPCFTRLDRQYPPCLMETDVE